VDRVGAYPCALAALITVTLAWINLIAIGGALCNVNIGWLARDAALRKAPA